jgi:hypothetical protein
MAIDKTTKGYTKNINVEQIISNMNEIGQISTGWDRMDLVLLEKVRTAKRCSESINIRGVELELFGTWEQSDDGTKYFNFDEVKCNDVASLLNEQINNDQIQEAVDGKYS